MRAESPMVDAPKYPQARPVTPENVDLCPAYLLLFYSKPNLRSVNRNMQQPAMSILELYEYT